MSLYRQLNERRQLTLPPKLLQEVGARTGQYFEIQTEGRRLVLIPREVEEGQPGDYDWKALARMIRREKKKAKTFRRAAEAKDFLKKFTAT